MKRMVGALYLLISCSLLLYGGFLVHERTTPIPEAYANLASSDQLFSLSIPSLNIDLPVYTATISATTWQTTKRGISYLSTSPLPGEYGNSVMYGHNWPNLLGNLHKVKPGDAIFVTRAHVSKRFIVRYISVVTPNESSVYAPSNDTRLTLYTCTGFLDKDRLVLTAFPDML